MSKIKLIREIDENVPIEWWKRNRQEINTIIRMFNDWQIDKMFDKFRGEVVKVKANLLKDESEKLSMSEWQIEILNQIIEHIETISNMEN